MGAFEKWDYVMGSVVSAAFYRVLGISSIHANINEMVGFVQEQENRGNGCIVWIKQPYFFTWNNIRMGEGLFFNLRFFGLPSGVNSVVFRESFWKMYVVRSKIESILGLPFGSFALMNAEDIHQRTGETGVGVYG